MTQKSLDDYNPFAQQNYQSKPAAAIIPTTTTTQQPQQPAAAATSPNTSFQQTKPPAYVPTSAQTTTLNLSEIEKQQQELERRAAELDRREQNLNAPAGSFGMFNIECFFNLKKMFQISQMEEPVIGTEGKGYIKL